ncbi:MAG: hypothetical protein IJ210_15205 [Clostridia bacterium]|nr:hypothetical protein [Clostridia bacterium]
MKNKNMRHKRISRRELKETIRELNATIQNERARHAAEITIKQTEYDKLQQRLEKLGSESIEVVSTDGTGIQRLDFDIETYGQYAMMYDPNAEEVQLAKEAIARSLAEALVEKNLIQFTTAKSDMPPYVFRNGICITGKVYIVPWECLNRPKSIAFTIRPDLKWKLHND